MMEDCRWVLLQLHNKCVSDFDEGLRDDSETAAAPELAETTDLNTHLANTRREWPICCNDIAATGSLNTDVAG